jgi:Protein of unknown function (DUF3455)
MACRNDFHHMAKIVLSCSINVKATPFLKFVDALLVNGSTKSATTVSIAELSFRTPQRYRVHGKQPKNRQVLECVRASAAFTPRSEFCGRMLKQGAQRRQNSEWWSYDFVDATGQPCLILDQPRMNLMKSNFSAIIMSGWLAVFMVGCSSGSSRMVSVPIVPETLKVSPGEALSFAAEAKGVQIYECRARKDDATKFEWVFKAPEADLFDQQGRRIGRHYAGPTWEAIDGSKVVGEIKAREPSPDANAIPWLLLAARKHEGNGVFTRVTSIQRLETVGGKAPAQSCDQSSQGNEVRVPYTAVYFFYTSKASAITSASADGRWP